MKGTTPEGARTEREAAQWVRGMFGRVAHRYDFANHLLSFNMDVLWRARTVRCVRHILARPDARVLDICCGTADLTLALARNAAGHVAGSDFCHPMLVEAKNKIAKRGARTPVFEADAMRLPLRDGSFDLITVAFGFRNLANYADGLAEMRRVLRPGGRLLVLEFSRVWEPLSRFYDAYSFRVLPWLGARVAGDAASYRYLAESIRVHPPQAELAAMMERAGLEKVEWFNLSAGVCALHVGHRF